LSVTKGLAAPEVGAVRTRALELCRQVGETPQLFSALWGARSFYLMRAEFQTARDLAERLVLLAQQAQDPTLLLEAHTGLGSVLLSLGELGSARIHFEHALALYDPRQRRASIAHYGGDIGSSSVPALAQVLWLLGYPDQARKRSHEALTLAQEIAHPFSTAVVWMMNTWVYQFLHAARAVQREAEALVTLSNEQGLSTLRVGTILRGWALAGQGQTEEGIQQIQQGLTAHRASGTERSRPYYLALLAEAYGKAEQEEEGLTVLSEALEVVERTGERMYEAELYRLKGELTLARSKVQSLKPILPAPVPQAQVSVVEGSQVTDPQGEAEACFHQAIDIARRQEAKSWELRATVSLARLWQQHGKSAEAHGMLSDIYHWFTEGFDTKDLQEAKALLAELEHSV
jgi:predicted ATPase